ncbi:YbaB/EbfC family nucleoid-associated protein [Caulifigura coniformis]|nr:YbaB/EbfC family nucleoid-associated protein [Caulifigura coniformis]
MDSLEMFKQIANVAQLMKQAQAMQGRVHEIKAQLENLRVTGTSTDGMVEVDAAGDQRIVAVRIRPEALIAGAAALEQQVAFATNEALDRAKLAAAELMQSATGDLSGLGDLFPQLGSPR